MQYLTKKHYFSYFKSLLNGYNNFITLKEGYIMNSSANKSIECSVASCEHHCSSQNYCSLSKIQVGTHETSPTQSQCTDCMSFKKKC